MPLDGYTRSEREQIAASINAQPDADAFCPRCGEKLKLTAVAADPAVAYVRKRVFVVCTGCHRSVAVDRKR